MDSKVLKDLDFERVLNTLSKFLNTNIGHKYLYSIKPLGEEDRVFQRKAVEQLEGIFKKGVILPLYDFEGSPHVLEKIRVASNLSSHEFLEISNLLHNYVKLYEVLYNTVMIEKLPSVEFVKPILSATRKNIDDEGKIRDDATLKLKELTLLKKHIDAKLKGVLSQLLEDYYKKGMLREKFYTMKNHRYVFPFRPEVSPSGIVHGYSHTDKTIFVEPYEIVDIQNKLVKVEDERKEEEDRIRRNLIETLNENYETIKDIHDKIGWIDFLHAVALYKEEKGGVFVDKSDALYVKNLRHPVLVEIKGYENVVPFSIDRFSKKGLFISGPNAGGKTVVLKNIGIVALSYMYGLPVLAEKAEIFPVKSVFTVGFTNEQDISEGKSTFSGIIEEIKNIVEHAERGSIVLFDEPFSFTDPQEGEALQESIVNYLIDRGVYVFLTTHMWGLKFFAEAHPEIENATMLFDAASGMPLYRFKIGMMGKSHAIEIAENIGLPNSIIEYAKKRIAGEGSRVVDIITRLEKEEAELLEREKRLKDKEDEVNEREKRLKKYGKKLIKAEYEKVEKELKELLKELHKERKIKEKIKKVQVARKQIQKLKEDVDIYKNPAEHPEIGKNYRIKPTGMIGTLLEIRRKNAIVQIGNVQMEVPLEYLFEL